MCFFTPLSCEVIPQSPQNFVLLISFQLTIISFQHFNLTFRVEALYGIWQSLVNAAKIHCRCFDENVGVKFVGQVNLDFAAIFCALSSFEAEVAV